jgi:hypothetical protein
LKVVEEVTLANVDVAVHVTILPHNLPKVNRLEYIFFQVL